MLKKLTVLLTAGVFFINSPNFALAKEKLPEENLPEESSETNLIEEPFDTPDKPHPPLAPAYYDPPVYEEGQEPPQTVEPAPVDDGEGLEFLVYHKDGVMAFAIIADHEKYQLRPVVAKNQIPGRATVSQMNSPEAIATINASYFGINGTIYGNTKVDGLTAGTTYFIRSAMGIKADGSTIFARQSYRGVLQFNGEEVVVNGVNCERNENTVIVYNSWQGATTGTNDAGVEFIVQDGVVVYISRDKGNSYIPPKGFVISVHGTAVEPFKGICVGDAVNFDEDYINIEHGGDFNEAIHIVGAGPTLVKDGEVYVTADAEQFPNDIRIGRAPRSAVGITQYGDYILAVVDGRQEHSKGCTLTEWARILKNDFGAIEAINLDGGGSTELFFKGSLVNKPSDGRERLVADALTILPK